jgi:hypothetical protein
VITRILHAAETHAEVETPKLMVTAHGTSERLE